MSSLHRIWQFLIIIPLLIAASMVQALERGPQGTIRVGIFHVEPFNIIDQNKTPAGLNVDLLKEISREQKWTPQFVPVTWVEGLEGLQNEQIDLMVSVAYTPERAEVMDYSHESVLELWGQVFVRPEGKLKNINDLAGLRVGVMRKDINGSNFIKTAESLGVQCEIVEFPSYVEVFTAVQKNEVDAGIAHQHYGLRHAKAYNLVGSAMIFSPISIYFASKKGKHHELLGSIDAQLSQWKRHKDSYYYERVDYWLGIQSKRTKFPRWLIYAAITVALSLLVVSAFTLLLRRTVKIRTAELHESEVTFRKLFEDSSDAILLIDKTGVFVECNQAALDLLKMTREQFLLLPPVRISPEFQPNGRRSAEAAPEMIALAYAKGLHRFDWTCVNAQGGEFIVEVALMPISIKGQTMLHTSWRDITERKQVEEENRRFKTIADNALYGKAIADLKGNLLYVNRFFASSHGYEPEQLVGKHLSSLHSEEQMEAVSQLLATMAGEGHFLPTTVWHRHRDGRDFPMLMSGIVIKDDYGKPQCLAASAIDITAQHQAEAKRIESESILRDILESTLSGFWDWDLVANTEYLSPTLKRMFGYEDHEMENSPESWQKIIFPEDLPGVLEVFDRHVKSHGVEPFYNEIRYRHRDGSTIWVICAGRVIEWSDAGAPIRMVGCHVDITERKRGEVALRESEEKFRQMTDGVREVFWLGSLDWNEIYYVSPAYTTVWGKDATDLYQNPRSWFDQVIEEDKEKVRTAIPVQIPSDALPIVFPDYRIRRTDGSLIWISAKAYPVLDSSGKPYRIAGIAEDITERKKLETERQKLFLLVESSSEFIGMCDLDMQPVYVNPAGCRMVGLPDMAAACRVKVQDYYFPEDQAVIRDEFFPRVLSDGQGDIEIRLRHFQTGEPIWISAYFFVVRDSSGQAISLAIVGRDITERKRAEEEKKMLNAQLQQAQKLEAIGTLAGGIAHDFNNILGAIVGYAEMIRDDFPPGAPGIHDINQVLKASHRAKDLVKQILAFSRQVEDRKIPVHPAVIVKEAITLLRSSLPTTITITQDIDADAGMVLANPTQMHQIVMNLATNAFHAMEVKGGTLAISLQKKSLSSEDVATEPELCPGVFVQLSIKDSGEGMPPEIRERIFDPFFTTKEVGKGTGLGLSTVYSIVKGCHGAIACDSRVGEGTEFRILLPVLEGLAVEDNEVAGFTPHGKEHILLIDDEEMLVELGQAMLKRLGYHVTTRRNSLDALMTFQNQPDAFDLVITDQTMAGMTGVDLARRILQIRPDMPIILCTGYSSQISEDKAKAAGIKGFAYKPLAKKDMGELIRKVLDRK